LQIHDATPWLADVMLPFLHTRPAAGRFLTELPFRGTTMVFSGTWKQL
jgi:hypothetical protein